MYLYLDIEIERVVFENKQKNLAKIPIVTVTALLLVTYRGMLTFSTDIA